MPRTTTGQGLAAFLRGLLPETRQFDRQIRSIEDEAAAAVLGRFQVCDVCNAVFPEPRLVPRPADERDPVSALLPTAILRRALVMVGPPRPPATWTEHELRLVAEALEEAGYITVARADVHALRAAADKLLRFTPGDHK